MLDLRGNEGGAAGTALPLVPYLAAVDPAQKRPSRIAASRPWMLATPDNERIVMRSVPAGRDTAPAVQALLTRLRAAPTGTPVRHVLDDGLPRPWRPPIVHARPREVAVLGETRWHLGYPTVIANDSVPGRGIRGRGIAPHDPLDPRAPDVLERLRQRPIVP